MPASITEHNATREQVIEQAYKGERAGLLSFINRRIAEVEDAEDILQDVFYELVEHYNPLAPVERVAAWLYRVARNKVTDWYRKKKTERMVESESGKADNGEDEPLLLADLIPSFDTPADKKLLINLVSDALSEALDELPETQRDVFVMHELEGISLKDIATLIDTPIKTVISRKRYAVLYLREHLQELYFELIND